MLTHSSPLYEASTPNKDYPSVSCGQGDQEEERAGECSTRASSVNGDEESQEDRLQEVDAANNQWTGSTSPNRRTRLSSNTAAVVDQQWGPATWNEEAADVQQWPSFRKAGGDWGAAADWGQHSNWWQQADSGSAASSSWQSHHRAGNHKAGGSKGGKGSGAKGHASGSSSSSSSWKKTWDYNGYADSYWGGGAKKSAKGAGKGSWARHAAPSSSHGRGAGKKFQCQFTIGIDEEPSFKVVKKVLGPHGQFVKKIAEETGAKLRLRGRGSGFLEGPSKTESADPLMLCVSVLEAEYYSTVKRLVTELLEDVYKQYMAHCQAQNVKAPKLRVSLLAFLCYTARCPKRRPDEEALGEI
eukprot:TRINITY_DN10474_c0_g1_i1.p1 TRINITY_DN10474_c0_g1~~TRINITY_DN10474_c0_g1_i1.p1  ORF type:complete len:356 (+),score=71.43 TRINITY_DN10474_c0_g1_i1:100-1167(+)